LRDKHALARLLTSGTGGRAAFPGRGGAAKNKSKQASGFSE
jgi:hypothetical protein